MTGALITIGTWLSSKLLDKGFDKVYSDILSDSDLNKKFYNAVNKTSKDIQKDHPDVLGGSIEFFFTSDDVFNELFKLLFKSSKINLRIIENSFDTQTLPVNFIENFIIQLRNELLKDPLFDKILSDNELFILFQGIDLSVKKIVENTSISAKDVKEIKDLLTKKIGYNFSLQDFKELYKKNAINSLSQINFLGLGIDTPRKIKRKDLQDIFVSPLFKPIATLNHNETKSAIDYDENNDELDEEDEKIGYKNILNFHDRIVILGNPGAGKSVLVKSLMCDILAGNSKAFSNDSFSEFIPFRIELRKYLAYKKENKSSLLKYISSTFETDYQINNITEYILNDILTQQKCIIFFDGLDEIFNINDKINVKIDIENFQNGYSLLRSITTSRIIGYEETSLNNSFKELLIKRFNSNQIDEYVKKWYIKEEENDSVRNKEVDDLLSKKHEIDKELISNPLLLSLIVIIYRNALKIPESKLEIYQSCTKTLVDKWEAIKDLKFDLDPEIFKNKDQLFADLAYWQYQKLSGASPKITYEKAKITIAKSLIRLDIANEFTKDIMAEQFMDYASKRSIYFEDNFTHKTFLEYYTAYWIYSNVERVHNIKLRNSIITKYIGNSFWNIVLELLFNLIDRDLGTTSVIDNIVNDQMTKSDRSIPFLLYVSLKLKNISKKTISKIVHNCIKILLNKSVEEIEKDNQLYNGLEVFFSSSFTGRKFVFEQIALFEQQFRSSLSELTQLYTLYLEMNLLARPMIVGAIQFEVSNPIKLKEIINTNKYLYMIDSYSYQLDEVFFERFVDFLEIFEPNAIYKSYTGRYERFSLGPYIHVFINRLIRLLNVDLLTKYICRINDCGVSKQAIIDFAQTNGSFIHWELNMQINVVAMIDDVADIEIVKIILLYLKKTIFIYSSSSKIAKSLSLKTSKYKGVITKFFDKKLDDTSKIEAVLQLT